VASILLVGGGLGSGCGTVTPVDNGTGGSGGHASGGTGGAGTAGGAGNGGSTAGTMGTAGRGGVDGGGGTGGAVTGGRGGSDSGAAGAGGRGGAITTSGTGGVATGGRGGTSGVGGSATAGNGGTTGTGGVATGGRGGTTGTGGVATGGRGGTTGTGGTGGVTCARGACPALAIADLEAIDDSKAPGFDAPGFRCKSLTVCPPTGSCTYFSSTTVFGSLQSAEDSYTDGVKLTTPAAVHFVIDGGAASQCGNPAVTFTADEFITFTFDGGKKVSAYLPMFTGTSLSLYVATDGSTFTDAALTMPARLRPTP